jgi:hypothetical protein
VATQEYAGWLYQKPQLQSTEVQALFEQVNITLDDELLTELVNYGQEQRSYLLREQIIERVAQHTKLTAGQWEKIRDRLVVVHCKMTVSNVCDALYELVSYEKLETIEDELESLRDENKPCKPLELFEKLVKQAVAPMPKCFAVLDKPARASVFVRIDG